MFHRPLALVLVLALSAGCGARSGGTVAAPAAVPAPAATPAGAPAQDPESIRWVRDSAEFHAAFYQAYRAAWAHVEAEAARRKPGTWAVVLDADETIISNVIYQQERARQGLPYTTDSWAAWVRRREATPLPAAGEFLTRVRALGGRIAVVTNRLQSECDDTIAVFAKFDLAYDAILCRPDGSPSDKNPRFEAVRTGQTDASRTPIEVIAYIGDNIQDFPLLSQKTKAQGAAGFADFGARFFLLPNPMYGSWQ